jgi:hypothetical protein
MPHETGGISNESRGDAQSALESAARYLRGSPRPARTDAAREREILRGRQVRDLFAWAEENSGVIVSGDYLPFIEDAGQEHRVWLDALKQRYFKVTHPGRFGFSIIVSGAGEMPELVGATPLEYLQRLLLQNSLFGDDVRLVGVAHETQWTTIMTSQPNITGDEVSKQEIENFMRRLCFKPLRGLSLGNPGSLAFYRDLDEVAVFDAHPANFVKDSTGVILPIDLILLHADTALQKSLNEYIEE